MPAPQTRYVKSGDVNVAYQVLGDGPLDLVYCWGWVGHLDLQWNEPTVATFLRRLSRFSRLIMFDKRGTGLSDPVGSAPTFEDRMDDIRAVMDAVGSERAALLGFSEGSALASLFAATYPHRTSALVLYDSVLVGWAVPGAYEAEPAWETIRDQILETIEHWGDGDTMHWVAPSLPETAVEKRFWGTFERTSMSPGMARSLWDAIGQVDVRDAFPAISVPTLVLHHVDGPIPSGYARMAAETIPGARFVALPGIDHLPGTGDPEAIAGEIEEFLTGTRGAEHDRLLATVLFTDIVESTRRAAELGDGAWRHLRERHDAAVRTLLARFRGREIKQTGDGFLAAFDGPARAIRCAAALREEAAGLGIEVRAGIHTGECEVIGDDLAGMAVHVAARVAGSAQPNEVLVSGTVRDLVLGSGIELVDRGAHDLRGVPGTWRLFAVVDTDAPRPAMAPSEDPRVGLGDRASLRLARWAPSVGRTGARLVRRRGARRAR